MEDDTNLKLRFNWKKIHIPKTWYPSEIGEELMGYYGGKTLRDGPHGQYEVVVVHVPYKGSYIVSGTMLVQLVDSAFIKKGHPIRIAYQGRKLLGHNRDKKVFDLIIADIEGLEEDHLPKIE